MKQSNISSVYNKFVDVHILKNFYYKHKKFKTFKYDNYNWTIKDTKSGTENKTKNTNKHINKHTTQTNTI